VKLRENKAIHNSPSADGRDQAGPREIADDAGLSLPTVKKHVHLIFRKLEVTSRSQLIALMRSAIVRDLSPAKVESRGVVHVDQAAAREQAEAFGASNRDCPICNLTSGFFLHPSYFCLSSCPRSSTDRTEVS
jgi:hypothetical protein